MGKFLQIKLGCILKNSGEVLDMNLGGKIFRNNTELFLNMFQMNSLQSNLWS